MKILLFLGIGLWCAVTAAGQAAGGGVAAASNPALSNKVCESRVNDTVEKLLECIQQKALWRDLAEFQRIADRHPDPHGHGNRDTGTAGYKASVDYVARRMKRAGYAVTVQAYSYTAYEVVGTPQFGTEQGSYLADRDWYVARGTGSGALSAVVQPAGGSGTGCSPDEFSGFVAGKVALLERGPCSPDTQVANAEAARAAAVVLYNSEHGPLNSDAAVHGGESGPGDGRAFPPRLTSAAGVPVLGVSRAVGSGLVAKVSGGNAPVVRIEVERRAKTGEDYNLIADSPYGDSNHVVVVDAHLDSIYGAGMLDNASGSTTVLEIALKMAKTRTANQLRYIWFGGEEIGLLGSAYYTKHLTDSERQRIAFDIDVDVTATPNFDYLVADPGYASNKKRFPPNVVPDSQVGNQQFEDYFQSAGVPAQSAWFGNDGTDSNSFSLIGIPNTGILTQQDCCKTKGEVKTWGGKLGNYEGKIPSFDGGCVDMPHRWCDNLSNNDAAVLELASKAAAYTVFEMANHAFGAGRK